ncbi:aminodeoxychorismate/anthranilate synthase component II [Legionella israelensis]|uniref:anthranilate synthase component II n=1 Tax=Legionella israelensis TaxID=454 RepID=UPI00117BE1B8|nr:aminodeoxychorismate/anthranilate synthase component II [Legionella israelensis]QDP73056.1 aminodeoxychorismate/anthranilate synthase component II [Legionella israelensis]
MIVLIDNYDSFTYNLVQYFQCLGQKITVYKNDAISNKDIEQLNPQYIVISPGPKTPDDAGISLDVIKTFHNKIPILGICLGHQCLAQAFGGKIIQAPEIIHGKTSSIQHNYQKLFHGIPNLFEATRYHSLAVDVTTLPSCFNIDAWSGETIMAISHRVYPLFGLQFHPEAILSEHGLTLLSHFLQQKPNISTNSKIFAD